MAFLKKTITDCGSCNNQTNHKILYSKQKEEQYGLSGMFPTIDTKNYMVVECAGCGNISFLLRESSTTWEEDEESPNYIDANYPNDESDGFDFLMSEEHDQLPSNVHKLYTEVKDAFNNHSNILAGVGLRILVEAICLDQDIAKGDLKEKIQILQTQGLISANEHPLLDKLREIGNSSAHKIKQLPIDKLEYALLIINHIIRSIYILPKINLKLKI